MNDDKHKKKWQWDGGVGILGGSGIYIYTINRGEEQLSW